MTFEQNVRELAAPRRWPRLAMGPRLFCSETVFPVGPRYNPSFPALFSRNRPPSRI